MMTTHSERRPVRSRNTYFAKKMMQFLKKAGFKPNQISMMSIVFSVLAAFSLMASAYVVNIWHTIILVAAVLFILLRLLCNLFDGMLAIEGNFRTALGDIYNDLPDRPSDVLILIGVGYAAHHVWGAVEAGWVAAILALMTAYVRLLGKTAGTQQYFIGPMAKQHRMAIIIGASLCAAMLGSTLSGWIFMLALILIIAGSVMTIFRRLRLIAQALEIKQI